RHATLLRRPKRPYTFTQLVTLSDGSTFQHRTTSPTPIHRTTRDTRNAPLWNPSSPKLANFEVDEAGRLASFRAKFGRSWDSNAEGAAAAEEEGMTEEEKRERDEQDQEEEDNLLDLISEFGQGEQQHNVPSGKTGKKGGRK
ncbi:hypothetical protein PHISP_04173, partial [Aspergillus sp. HF37]